MGESKTKPTRVTASEFIARVPDPDRRADAKALVRIFERASGEKAVMWGPSIIGFGSYHYKYESGREGDMCRTGFSPRKAKHSLYVSCNCKGEEDPAFTALLARLGKHSRGDGGCLYVNKLADIDVAVLEEMIALGWKNSFEVYPG